MEGIRDQQESLARLHFELSEQQDVPTSMSDDGESSFSFKDDFFLLKKGHVKIFASRMRMLVSYRALTKSGHCPNSSTGCLRKIFRKIMCLNTLYRS